MVQKRCYQEQYCISLQKFEGHSLVGSLVGRNPGKHEKFFIPTQSEPDGKCKNGMR